MDFQGRGLGAQRAGHAARHVPISSLFAVAVVVEPSRQHRRFYGLLVALALILPYAYGDKNNEVWGVQWLYHTSLLMVACAASGFVSVALIAFSKRHPVAPPRQLLYPMPFVGLALLSIDRVGMMDIPSMLVWALLLLPGPVYVHLSWAPRWRLLCMIEDGKDPFVGLEVKAEDNLEAEEMVGEDTEMLEVVDAFESE